MNTSPKPSRIAILAGVCGLAASIALGQPASPPPPQDDFLRGPAVQDRDVPGARSTFGDPDARGRQGRGANNDRDPRVMHRAFMDALRSLEAEEVAPELRLTEDQRAQIKTIDEELRAAADAWKAEHQPQIDALKNTIGEARERGRDGNRPGRGQGQGQGKGRGNGSNSGPNAQPDGPSTDDAATTTAQDTARQQLKTLRDSAPKPEDFHTRMWAVLSAPQQALVQSRLDNIRADNREHAADVIRDRARDRRNDGTGDRAPDRLRDRDGEGPQARDRRDPPGPGEGRTGARGQFAPMDPPPRAEARDFGPRRGPAGPTGPNAPGANPRFDRLMERFHALPPEAQDRIIQRIEEMLSRMEGRRGPRPAPPMDEVDVPPPPPPPPSSDDDMTT